MGTKDLLRSSATISDLDFLKAVASVRSHRRNRDGYYWVTIGAIEDILEIHPNRIRSKMRRMFKRGLITGCNCGCRGDIEVLPKGEDLLRSGI